MALFSGPNWPFCHDTENGRKHYFSVFFSVYRKRALFGSHFLATSDQNRLLNLDVTTFSSFVTPFDPRILRHQKHRLFPFSRLRNVGEQLARPTDFTTGSEKSVKTRKWPKFPFFMTISIKTVKKWPLFWPFSEQFRLARDSPQRSRFVASRKSPKITEKHQISVFSVFSCQNPLLSQAGPDRFDTLRNTFCRE